MTTEVLSPELLRDAFHDLVGRRRDVRREFSDAPLDDEVLHRVLRAAHAAPSVGNSQPWDFVLVRDPATRTAFHTHVATEQATFRDSLPPERRETFSRIKVEGVREAALGVVVTYDASRGGPHVLGRHAIADAGLYSTCLAVQNLWLAATAEGLGVGWVSFYRPEFLRGLLGIPEHVVPVAWLCLGPVTHLEEVPDLERHGWRSRRPLEAAVHHDRWDHTKEAD